MSKHSRSEKEKEKIAKLLGIKVPEGNPYESETDIAREAEAVLAYSVYPSAFVEKECKICHRPFAHTRGAVAYCSNVCRAVGLERIGIKWSWFKPSEQRWGPWPDAEPLVVPPEALPMVKQHVALSTYTITDDNNSLPESDKSIHLESHEDHGNQSDDVLDLLHELGLD